MREIDDVIGDAAADGRNGQRLTTQRLGKPQRIGEPVALCVGELERAPRLDRDRGERRVQPVRESLGVAHQPGRARILADADENALARGPGAGDGVRLHVGQKLLVDPLGRAPQRELAQGGQVAGREIMLERPLRLLGDVDLALLQPLDQIVGREVDQLDRIGAVEHRIRHGFAHPHMSNLRDDVVQAFDVLDVDGGVDVDAVGQQLLDIEVTFGVAAAGGVGVGELVDQRDFRPPRDHGIQVHLLDDLAAIIERLARDHLQPAHQRLGLGAAMGLDEADHDVDAGLALGVGALQHLVGLADAGSGADEDLELAARALLPARCFQQRLRRRTLFGIAALSDHQATIIIRAPRA